MKLQKILKETTKSVIPVQDMHTNKSLFLQLCLRERWVLLASRQN